MSAKSFFKSTAFKCIVVLLSIVLLCSVFLTICNALFYVSDEERLNRALSELYDGESVTTELAPGRMLWETAKRSAVPSSSQPAPSRATIMRATGSSRSRGSTAIRAVP